MSAPHQVSLTAKQQASDAGVELIELCSTITEDGRLLDHEIEALKDWTERTRDVELPARAFLTEKIRRAITVGVMTDTDRAELQVAMERVLPPEVRRTPKSVPRLADVADRNQPLETYEFLVADARADDRPMVIARYAFNGDEVILVRDQYNPLSRHATRVRLVSGYDIGFVPEADARTLAPHLDNNLRYRAHIRKILAGGQTPVPVVTVDVFSDEALVDDVRRTGEFRGPPLAMNFKTPVRGTPRPKSRPFSYTGIGLFFVLAALAALAIALT
jgi:hypothetical protein